LVFGRDTAEPSFQKGDSTLYQLQLFVRGRFGCRDRSDTHDQKRENRTKLKKSARHTPRL
jgi:hypothetical protein